MAGENAPEFGGMLLKGCIEGSRTKRNMAEEGVDGQDDGLAKCITVGSGQDISASDGEYERTDWGASKKRKFSRTEDERILEGINKYGRAWTRISELLEGRTPTQVRDRFRRIKERGNLSLSTSLNESCSEPLSPVKGRKAGEGEQVERKLRGQKGIEVWIQKNAGSGGAADSALQAGGGVKMPFSSKDASDEEGGLSCDRRCARGDQDLDTMGDLSRQLQNQDVLLGEIERLEQELERKEQMWARREQEMREQECLYRERVFGEVCKLLRSFESKHRVFVRELLAERAMRFGIVVGEEQRYTMGGTHFRLKLKSEQLEEEKAALERAKRNVQKRKNQLALNGTASEKASPTGWDCESSQVAAEEMENILLQEQVLKLRGIALKNMEMNISRELELLEIKTTLHLKEFRRIQEENASSWNHFPVLNGRYLILSLLGKGGFSEVYHAYDLCEFREVACKIHQLNGNWPLEKKSNYIRHSKRECDIHKTLVHPRVVRLYDYFEVDKNTFCVIMQYCKNGDLDLYLKQHRMLSEGEARILAYQIVEGLKYLATRKQKIIHYDLKPANILFDEDGYIKIADFGLSKIMDTNSDAIELTSQGAGTYWYLPPECFAGKNPHISSKVDVWSTGVIVYQMLFGCKPFGNGLIQKAICEQSMIHSNIQVVFPEKLAKGISGEAKAFLQRCLTPLESERPDVTSLSSDPWLYIHCIQRKAGCPKAAGSAAVLDKSRQRPPDIHPDEKAPSCAPINNPPIHIRASLGPSGLLTSGGTIPGPGVKK
ncbi:uncharacterized protein LOC126324526 [Schistocerca gregaria]|uniref:uncharacterized protein LOC126324526 n=1 Tax=Schistocerca gregaria TaxID=7010 RepID=UPI00211E50E6|nr:uncharacterized protein LOC126324526 [Schistocerca gregaria]